MKVCGEFQVEMVFKVCSKVRVEVGEKWKVVGEVGGKFNEEVGEKWLAFVISTNTPRIGDKPQSENVQEAQVCVIGEGVTKSHWKFQSL
jgi:hypothetical protein